MFEIEINIIWFLAVVAFGTAIQTITGFAMGLVTMAGVALSGAADIVFSAAVVSFISMVNAGISLRKGFRQVDCSYIKWIGLTFVPAMAAALVLLAYMSEHHYDLLKFLLGVVIILAASMVMISPNPFMKKSSPLSMSMMGLVGGVIGGLYSAGGGPIAYFMYRQPIQVSVIRFSILALVGLSTLARTIMVCSSGHMSRDILLVSAVAVPLVISVTLCVSHFLDYIPNRVVYPFVYLVLWGEGFFLVLGGTN